MRQGQASATRVQLMPGDAWIVACHFQMGSLLTAGNMFLPLDCGWPLLRHAGLSAWLRTVDDGQLSQYHSCVHAHLVICDSHQGQACSSGLGRGGGEYQAASRALVSVYVCSMTFSWARW